MFQTAGTILSRINEIVRWLKGIEETGEKTSAEVGHLRREIDIITREVGDGKTVADFQGRKLAELEAQVRKLQSEKHGLKISKGKAKAEADRLKQQLNH
jgi:hypothetical protein